MEMKAGTIPPVSPQPAGEAEKAPATGNRGGCAGAPGGVGPRDIVAAQSVLREALNVEPVADRELRIEFEKELHQIVVKVLDKETGELVRQIPLPEEISIAKGLRAAIRRMAGDQSGIAVDREV